MLALPCLYCLTHPLAERRYCRRGRRLSKQIHQDFLHPRKVAIAVETLQLVNEVLEVVQEPPLTLR